jgi:hypothetical protein
MNGLELRRALQSCSITRGRFWEIFSIDTFILPSKDFHYIVVNTARVSEPGEHWIVMYRSANGSKLEIFDSLSQSPYKYSGLVARLKQMGVKKIIYNSRGYSLQSSRSNTCGAHCLFFIYKSCKKPLSLSLLLSEYYTRNTDYNDCMVLAFVSQNFDLNSACLKKMLQTTKCNLNV